jgi:hypothetical protein
MERIERRGSCEMAGKAAGVCGRAELADVGSERVSNLTTGAPEPGRP